MGDQNWLENSAVRLRVTECLGKATAAGRALANYMLANLSELPFETSGTLAKKINVSELTVGRFCRSIGYRNFKELKESLKADISDSPWLIGDRLRAFQSRSAHSTDELARSLELEIAALVRVYELARTDTWNRAVRRLARVPRVFVAGFQTERGLAEMFGHSLRYLRDGVFIVDIAGGNFAEILLTDPKECALVLLSARRHSRQAHLLADRARNAHIPITLISDLFCDWGETYANEVFAVPTELNLFWDATTPMASLLQLMLNSIFIEVGPTVEDRMNCVGRLYHAFVGHTSTNPSGSKRKQLAVQPSPSKQPKGRGKQNRRR